MKTNKFHNNDRYKNCYLMGIDLGTSTLKVGIYDINGNEIAIQSIEYKLSYPGKDLVENDVEKYWNTICNLIKKTLTKINNPKKILAISLSSQGETIIPIDSKGRPLRPAIVWLDSRSEKEADDISKAFNPEEMFYITGQPSVDTSWPATRIKWFKENEPEIFDKAYKFLLLEDYITFKFTGKIFGENTVYNSTYYYDIIKLDYYEPILEYLKIDRKRLPEVVTPGTLIGNISEEASNETNLDKNTKFIMGAMDQLAGAIGAGNIKTGTVTENTGTAFAMVVSLDKPVFDRVSKIPCYIHVVKDKYCLMPYSITGGMVLKWFKDNFFITTEKIKRNRSIYDLMTDEASGIKPGCEGLIMLPHLSGAYIPENNPKARGVYFGIGINHSRSHFVRAILESIGFMMRSDIELFTKMKIKIDKIVSLGGGAKSKLWNQIKSDICNIEVNVPKYTETALLGASVIAGVGIGIYPDFETATKNIIKIKEKYTPNKDNIGIYNETYKKYKKLYDSLKHLF